MSGKRLAGHWTRFLTLGSVATGLIVGTARADEPAADKDYQEQVRRLNEVAGQKLEFEVQGAVREANQLLYTNPTKAAEVLKKTLAQVEDDTALAQSRRETLTRQLRTRIRSAELAAARTQEKSEKKAAPVYRPETDGRSAEQAAIAREIQDIRKLQKDGQLAAARTRAEALAARHPDNPAVYAALRTYTGADRYSTEQANRYDRSRRTAAVAIDVDRTATPPNGEVDYPKDWKERTAKRGKGSNLSDKERMILNGLKQTITVSFKETPLQEVVNTLQAKIGAPIILDKTAMQELQVTYESPITKDVKGVSVRTFLKMVLADLQMAYIIKDETIHVTSQTEARNSMVTRTYYIGDLLGNGSGLGGLLGLQQNQALMGQEVNTIMQMIKDNVDPRSWGDGQGTIAYHPATQSLVIRQTAEIHALLGGLH